MPTATVRRGWLDPEGKYESLRGKTCRDCPRCQTSTRMTATVVRVERKCSLTHETVNPDMGVCVLYPIQVGWKRVFV